MRIAVDMHFLQGKSQGIKTFLEGLYGAIVDINSTHDLVFVFEKDDEISAPWREHGEILTCGSISRYRRLGYTLGRLIKAHGAMDLAHFSGVIPAGIPCSTMVTIHDVLPMTHPQFFSRGFRLQQNAALRWSAYRGDILTAVSDYTRHSISDNLKLFGKDIRLLPNGVDGKWLKVNRDVANAYIGKKYGFSKYILTVGRIDPRKNHLAIVNAFERLAAILPASQLPELVIVGNIDNGYSKGGNIIREFSERLPISWLRNVDSSDLINLYAGASIVVMASYAEGYGLPIIESLATGTPVIAANNTAMPEVIGEAGVLFNEDNPAELARLCRQLLENRELWTRLSNLGRERAKGMTWECSARRYLDIIDDFFSTKYR